MKKNKAEKEAKQMAEFIHLAFCIDGTVTFCYAEKKTIKDKKTVGVIFEIVDKKRGTFYVGWYA